MDALLRDLRHAVRSLKRTPDFTIAVLGLLGLGIGMSTAMFTVFKTIGLLVRTLAHLESVDLGYYSDHLAILGFTATRDALPNRERRQMSNPIRPDDWKIMARVGARL